MIHKITITPDNISTMDTLSELFENNTVFGFIHMDGCIHCVQFEDIWKSFSDVLDADYKGDVVLLRMNQNVRDQLEAKTNITIPNVQGFPHIFIRRNDNTFVEFENERSTDALITFLSQHSNISKSQAGGKRRFYRYLYKTYKKKGSIGKKKRETSKRKRKISKRRNKSTRRKQKNGRTSKRTKIKR